MTLLTCRVDALAELLDRVGTSLLQVVLPFLQLKYMLYVRVVVCKGHTSIECNNVLLALSMLVRCIISTYHHRIIPTPIVITLDGRITLPFVQELQPATLEFYAATQIPVSSSLQSITLVPTPEVKLGPFYREVHSNPD